MEILKELFEEVKEQLESEDIGIRGIAIHTLREFDQKDSYDCLYEMLKSEKNLKGNILIALSKLDFDKTLSCLENYLLSANRDLVGFVAYNVLYDHWNNSKKKGEIGAIIKKRSDGESLLKNIYYKVRSMLKEDLEDD